MAEGYNSRNIRNLLTEGFSEIDLRNFCFDTHEFRPVYNQLAQLNSIASIVQLLLEYSDRQELLDRLLAWAEKSNPAKYIKHQPYHEPTPSPTPSPGDNGKFQTAEKSSHRIGRGLDALIELMQAPEVRDDVTTFQAVFNTACEQIDILADYKDLHDLLHELEFECHNPIRGNAGISLQNESDREELNVYKDDLQDIIDRLWDMANFSPVAEDETFWIKTLNQAHQELREAIENSDIEKLDKAAGRVNGVLKIQPTNLNRCLKTAARALRLPHLVEAMVDVYDNLARADLDPQKVRQFKDGVDALTTLNHNLTALVESHDKWQVVDSELRLIADLVHGNSKGRIDAFESWPDLKAMAEPLYVGSTEVWALNLKANGEKLDSAIAAKNPDALKKHFQDYYKWAGRRFFRVDKELKNLCGELRQVGKPLTAVMEIIK